MEVGDIAYCMVVASDNQWHPEKCRILGKVQDRPYNSVEYLIRTRKFKNIRLKSKYLFPDKQSCQDSCDNNNEFLIESLR